MAKDLLHDAVKAALENDNWFVTNDPLIIRTGKAKIQIDLGAERIITAEKGEEKIAVEVKSFNTFSVLYSFHEALGQYLNYRSALREVGMQREVFLATSETAYYRIQEIPFLLDRLEEFNVKIIVVNIESEQIVKWKR